jgi:uncharacterized protein (DUF58 family)
VRTRPTPRALAWLGAWLVAALAGSLAPALLWAWSAGGAVLLCCLLYDARALRRLPTLQVERHAPALLPVGVWSAVELRLLHGGATPLALLVADHVPAESEVAGLPQRLDLPPGEGASLRYQLRPRERGDHAFAAVEVWCRSPWQAWEGHLTLGEGQPVRVLPNFRPLARYATLAVEDRLGEMGIRVRPRRGEGLEFQQLRDYRAGDSERQIDWKATCRRQRLVSREYQEEKDQRVVLMLDCGRRMRARDGERTHFDDVLEAALLLTFAAVRRGDAVGLATFGGPTRWLPPLKGPAAMSALLQAVYDLPTTREASDYLAAASRLATLQRRRALVVLLTNLRDEDTDDLQPALRLLASRHLVLLASLRERALEELRRQEPADLQAAVLLAAAHGYEASRRRVHEQVAARGVMTLDVEPQRLAVALVEKYLEIKRRGVL